MPASGRAATRHLRDSMTASGTISFIPPGLARTCVKAVANLFLAQTLSIDIVSLTPLIVHGAVTQRISPNSALRGRRRL